MGGYQMDKRNLKWTGAALASAIALWTGSAAADDIRFMCAADGNECATLETLFARYEKDNPGTHVVIDVVGYKAILENLPVQLAGGTGPDMALVTDFGGLAKYFLDLTPYVDANYWNTNFGNTLRWSRTSPDDKGIYGMNIQLTITGAYINKTLFEQAGIAVPGEKATWDEWAEASRQVAKATGVPFPMAMDRSGHRIAGPAISNGAKIFDDAGNPILVDAPFADFMRKFVDWNKDGTMAKDVWAGIGGTSYQDAAQEFINAQLVFYYSGSWQVQRLDKAIGDSFDWEVVGSPCGPAACSGMPGGSGLVGFKQTKNPEAVAKLINYIAQKDNYAEFIGKTRNVPAHEGVAKEGVVYTDASQNVAKALKGWNAQIAKLSPIAYSYQGYKNSRTMYNITVQRVTQAIVGEMSIDEAMEKAKQDVAAAIQSAGK